MISCKFYLIGQNILFSLSSKYKDFNKLTPVQALIFI